jgi:hypothetical protein
MTNFREATVNIGCIGLVTIKVCSDGYWTMVLEDKRGNFWYQGADYGIDAGMFINIDGTQLREMEGWMWNLLVDKIDELNIMHERDALYVPEVKHAVA